MFGPLKLTLLVVKRCHGRDKYQSPVPQSATPAGYAPSSGRSGLDRSSNVMVAAGTDGVAVAIGMGVAVGVDVGAAPLEMTRLSKLVNHPLLLDSVTAVHGLVQLVRMERTSRGWSVACTSGDPAQLRVTVLAVLPPLSASIWTTWRGASSVKLECVGVGPKLRLLLLK